MHVVINPDNLGPGRDWIVLQWSVIESTQSVSANSAEGSHPVIRSCRSAKSGLPVLLLNGGEFGDRVVGWWFHKYRGAAREVDRESITEVEVCEVLFVVEECALCSTRLHGLAVTGDAPEQMQTYKRVLYRVYEAFYDDPRPHEHITLRHGLANASLDTQLTIQSDLSTVIESGRDDAETGAAKQSAVELWTQVLAEEFGDDE